MVQSESTDILIVGAGVVGAALALKLSRESCHSVTLLERGPAAPPAEIENQRVLALGEHSLGLLSDIGVSQLDDLAISYPYIRMHVWESNSSGALDFSADDVGTNFLGKIVDANALTQALQQACIENKRIKVYFEQSLTSMQQEPETVVLETQERSFQATLLIAADGANSWVRSRAGIFSAKNSYKQRGIVAKVATALSHEDCAWQRFLGAGPLAFLPLDKGLCSVVWSCDDESAVELLGLSENEFCLKLAEALDHRLGSVSLRSPRFSFPLSSSRAEEYFRKNVVLVGDAAHTIHPLAGQGANLGFKDVTKLSELLSTAAVGELASVRLLARYQSARKKDNEQTDLLMTTLNSLYANGNPLFAGLRGIGMSTVNNMPWLRQMLAQHASG